MDTSILKDIESTLRNSAGLPDGQKFILLSASIRKWLSQMLFINHQCTFEEIIATADSFHAQCNGMQKQIDSLLTERSSLLSQESAKKDKKTLEAIGQLDIKVTDATKKTADCRRVADALESPALRHRIALLCTGLSTLQFSPDPVRRALEPYLFDFLLIANQLLPSSFQIQGKKHASINMDLGALLAQTIAMLTNNDIVAAKRHYADCVAMYVSLRQEEQAQFYPAIFSLWFELYTRNSVVSTI